MRVCVYVSMPVSVICETFIFFFLFGERILRYDCTILRTENDYIGLLRLKIFFCTSYVSSQTVFTSKQSTSEGLYQAYFICIETVDYQVHFLEEPKFAWITLCILLTFFTFLYLTWLGVIGVDPSKSRRNQKTERGTAIFWFWFDIRAKNRDQWKEYRNYIECVRLDPYNNKRYQCLCEARFFPLLFIVEGTNVFQQKLRKEKSWVIQHWEFRCGVLIMQALPGWYT